MRALVTFFRDIKLGQARAVLFGAWLFGALGVFMLFGLHSLQQYYGNEAGDVANAWSWLVPTVGPTLSIITASAIVNALERDATEEEKLARPIVFYAALGWSVAYLAALVVVIWTAVHSDHARWDEVHASATTPLGAMQTILAGLLGVFFAAKNKE